MSLLSHDRYQYDSLILSSDTGGLPELSPLHKQPVSWNFLLQSYIDCLVDGGLPYRLLKRRCTRVTEFVFASSSTQKAFCTTVAAILLHWCQWRWRGADVMKECLEKIFIFPLRYHANCVSTTVTVWYYITLKVSVIVHRVPVVSYSLFQPLFYVHQICSFIYRFSGLGGLEVACWPLVPKFAGSNPAEAIGFLRVNKNLQHVEGHGYLSVVIVVCCQVEVSATNWSLVQRSPTDCGASLCVI